MHTDAYAYLLTNYSIIAWGEERSLSSKQPSDVGHAVRRRSVERLKSAAPISRRLTMFSALF